MGLFEIPLLRLDFRVREVENVIQFPCLDLFLFKFMIFLGSVLGLHFQEIQDFDCRSRKKLALLPFKFDSPYFSISNHLKFLAVSWGMGFVN